MPGPFACRNQRRIERFAGIFGENSIRNPEDSRRETYYDAADTDGS